MDEDITLLKEAGINLSREAIAQLTNACYADGLGSVLQNIDLERTEEDIDSLYTYCSEAQKIAKGAGQEAYDAVERYIASVLTPLEMKIAQKNGLLQAIECVDFMAKRSNVNGLTDACFKAQKIAAKAGIYASALVNRFCDKAWEPVDYQEAITIEIEPDQVVTIQ